MTDDSIQAERHATRPARLGLIALLALHAALVAASIFRNSVTFDEYAHLPAGAAYWRFGTRAFAIHNLTPPLLRLWATAPVLAFASPLHLDVPDVHAFLEQDPRDRHWNYGEAFLRANFAPGGRYHRLFVVGRVAMLPISCFGVWLAWKWTRELHGSQAAALAAGAMVALNPDLIAHGSLVGTDSGTAVAIGAALWLWWRRIVPEDTTGSASAGRWMINYLPVSLAVAVALL
jgi:hypothetical protein